MTRVAGYRWQGIVMLGLMIGLVLQEASFISAADQPDFDLESTMALASTLAKYVGKRVTVHLKAGHELTGTVTKVGQTAVHLSELTGKEFFDAVVRLDDISALVIRVRGK